jgi:sulfite oxidase
MDFNPLPAPETRETVMSTQQQIPFEKHPQTLIKEREPFNSGAPLDLLAKNAVTPVELFFVRNHGDVPEVDAEKFRLKIDGLVNGSREFSLQELRSEFPTKIVTATMQCAGNRRSELMRVAPIPGELRWNEEAIGNAQWRGVSLRDVLDAVGVKAEAKQAAFVGLDMCERKNKRFGFGGSIPIEKAMNADTLLALEMNGKPLAPVHGAPLRAIVPGYIGARSVKWLSQITLQEEPSDNYFQAHAYKIFPPQVNAENADWSKGLMLGEMNLNAVICRPHDGETLQAGRIEIAGYAMAGGGRTVERVDVSVDGGATWTSAELNSESSLWSWRLWRTILALSKGEHEIIVRAIDSAANTQPESSAPLWNFKGYMNNAWHRVRIIIL